jgi:2-phosphosulfolactate phosphatase
VIPGGRNLNRPERLVAGVPAAPTPADEPADSVRVLQAAEADELDREETAVVVDVLRATSTATVALHRGAASVHPVGTPEDARRRAEALDDPLLVGERDRGSLDGFVDNSPADLAERDLTGRDVVLTTTNGTGALLAARGAGRVLAAGLVNASAVARAVAGEPVALVAAGWRGQPAEDDDACCAYLAELLHGQRPDVAAAIEELEASTSAVELRKAGKGDDVDVCLDPDAAPVVPRLDGDRLIA